MACLDMYNSDQHKGHHCPPMSPRISFSNDFVDSQPMMKQERSSLSRPPASSDFEFSVTGYSMMSADELFSKGRLLPFKDNNVGGGSSQMQRTTIRDQLLVDDDGDVEVSLRPPKGSSSTRWKGLLGLRRSHIGSKKVERVNSNVDQVTAGEIRRPSSGSFVHDQDQQMVHVSNRSSQEVLSEGGSGCRDLEIGI